MKEGRQRRIARLRSAGGSRLRRCRPLPLAPVRRRVQNRKKRSFWLPVRVQKLALVRFGILKGFFPADPRRGLPSATAGEKERSVAPDGALDHIRGLHRRAHGDSREAVSRAPLCFVSGYAAGDDGVQCWGAPARPLLLKQLLLIFAAQRTSRGWQAIRPAAARTPASGHRERSLRRRVHGEHNARRARSVEEGSVEEVHRCQVGESPPSSVALVAPEREEAAHERGKALNLARICHGHRRRAAALDCGAQRSLPKPPDARSPENQQRILNSHGHLAHQAALGRRGEALLPPLRGALGRRQAHVVEKLNRLGCRGKHKGRGDVRGPSVDAWQCNGEGQHKARLLPAAR